MPTPMMSDTSTEGIRIGAAATFLPQESDPESRRFVFGYRIVIVNEGKEPAKLISRHWRIVDAHGREETVDGPGVVGQTPRLGPGEGFKYASACPLGTSWGTMEGTYRMVRDDGTEFDAAIGRFFLTMPTEGEAVVQPVRGNAPVK